MSRTKTTAAPFAVLLARSLSACALLGLAPGEIRAQIVRRVPAVSLTAGPVGVSPAPAPAAGLTLFPAMPAPLAFAPVLTATVAPAPRAATPVRALAALKIADGRMKETPAPALEWRRFFDGTTPVPPDASVAVAPSLGDPLRDLPPGVRSPRPATARPSLGLEEIPAPAPKPVKDWKARLGVSAFWLVMAAVVPGGFLVLGAYWLYKLLTAYLRRKT